MAKPHGTQLQDFDPRNPFRELKWRWERACNVVAGGPPLSRRRDDVHTRRAVRYRMAYEAAQSNHDYYVISQEYPGLYWAHKLYDSREDDAIKMDVHALEARILANQPRDAIARRLRLTMEVIESYEVTFFDVAPYYEARDYIQFRVLGDAAARGIRSREYDLLWKLFGYFCGPFVLDTLIDTFGSGLQPVDAESTPAYLKDIVRGKMDLRALVSIQTLNLTDMTAIPVLDLWIKARESESKSGSAAAGKEALLMNIGAMIRSVNFSVGAPDTSDDTYSINAYDRSGIELKSGEMLQIAAGTIIDVEDADFPPVPPKTTQLAIESAS